MKVHGNAALGPAARLALVPSSTTADARCSPGGCRLDVLLSAPVSRSRLVAAGFAATAIELAAVLAVSLLLTAIGSWLSDADLSG